MLQRRTLTRPHRAGAMEQLLSWDKDGQDSDWLLLIEACVLGAIIAAGYIWAGVAAWKTFTT